MTQFLLTPSGVRADVDLSEGAEGGGGSKVKRKRYRVTHTLYREFSRLTPQDGWSAAPDRSPPAVFPLLASFLAAGGKTKAFEEAEVS